MPMTPEDVERQVFTEKRRGYDMEEVDLFLDRVVVRMRELVDERDRLARELQHATTQGGADPEEADLLRRTLLTAQKAADETMEQARSEAERVLGEARQQAVREREQLREEAEQLARAVEDLKRFRRDYTERLRGAIRSHLRMLEERSLPDVPQEAEEVARRASGSAQPQPPGVVSPGPGQEPVPRSALDTADDVNEAGLVEDAGLGER